MSDGSDWLGRGSLALIETGINRALALDPDSRQRLAPLVGRTLQVHLTDTPVAVFCDFASDGVSLRPANGDADADASVRSSMAGLVALAGSRGRRSRDVEFRGDVGVIQQVKRLFGEIDIDWEEQLARVTGDIVAHQIGRAVRGGQDWSRHAGGTFLRNLGEYLTEERGFIPPETELAGFVEDVHRLRTDVDRFEARLRRLERERGESS